MKIPLQDIKEIEHKNLLEMLDNGEFSKKYPSHCFISSIIGYLVSYNGSYVGIYNREIKVTIEFENRNKKHQYFRIFSSFEFENICKKNKIPLDSLSIKINNQIIRKYNKSERPAIIPFIKNDKITFVKREKEKLPETLKFGNFKNKESSKIKELSSFYKKYFGDDINPDSDFKYFDSFDRMKISSNIFSLLAANSLRQYKCTGPCYIGKSITLLNTCRKIRNTFYLNLKLLATETRLDSYAILKEEFSNVEDDIYTEIRAIIEENYSNDTNPFDTIFRLISYFENKTTNVLFVLDQYKPKYFSCDFSDDLNLKKFGANIKFVFCSSINDHYMRDECYKTWNQFFNNRQTDLNISNQNYYFYYDELYYRGVNDYNKIEKMFNGINKYVAQYKQININILTEKDNVDKKISKHITGKMKEFFDDRKINFDFALSSIKNIINKKYKREYLNSVLFYCPLKYLIVKFFSGGYFQIKMQFPFLKNIIDKELTAQEVDNYFLSEKYTKDTIANDSIKGDYFEYSVKKGLSNNMLPVNFDDNVILKEIITMEMIEKDNDDDIDEEENEEDSKDYSLETEAENDIIIETKIKSIKIKKLMSKFSIKSTPQKNEDIIEKYRRKEINKISEKNISVNIPNETFDGDKNYLIGQKKRTGRLLDYALLYGEKNNKIFVGFQIKCYFEATTYIDPKFINKEIIKQKCRHILFKSMITFNCKITSWHYFLIFYYNPKKDQKYNLNSDIYNKCLDVVEFLFYDPVGKAFYDNSYKPLSSIKLTETSNLNFNFGYIQMNLIFNLNDIKKIGESYTEDQLEESFLDDFSFMKCGKDKQKIIEKIAKIMEIEGKLYLKNITKDLWYIKAPPKRNSILLYKQKNIGFIGMKSIYSDNQIIEVKCYDLHKQRELEDFYEKYDPTHGKMYSLIKTRSYREFKEEYKKNFKEYDDYGEDQINILGQKAKKKK